jgi:hypothetical protein
MDFIEKDGLFVVDKSQAYIKVWYGAGCMETMAF